MSTSKVHNNKLAVQVATDRRYKVQKNGTVRKLRSDGKYHVVGTTRHGYNVISYKGKKIVTARVIRALMFLEYGYRPESVVDLLNDTVVVHENGVSLDDRRANLAGAYPGGIRREGTVKRFTQKQKDRMVELFCEGFSVAKIARRFRRKISRSHISKIIKHELGVEA